MTVRQEIKSQLAKLLATEDLVVEHKKVETACFNVHTRVLTLPLWEKASNTVYDLLVGHEVGHALYTPDEDWLKEHKIPPQFVNVVEDARIEKLMKILKPLPMFWLPQRHSTNIVNRSSKKKLRLKLTVLNLNLLVQVSNLPPTSLISRKVRMTNLRIMVLRVLLLSKVLSSNKPSPLWVVSRMNLKSRRWILLKKHSKNL